MRDFGDQERLLLSSERQSLWSIVTQFDNEEGESYSPYYSLLSKHKAQTDNIKFI